MKNKKGYVIGLVVVFVLYLILTVYLFAFKETSKSYSLTQSWKEYYSVDDWNLPMHAIVDIDGDGKEDLISYTHCAFLSSVKSEEIPTESSCREPEMSVITFLDDSTRVGQKLDMNTTNGNSWLKKSYLVKTKDNKWKYYNLNGLRLSIFELGENNLFFVSKPTILDKIDLVTYQFGHLGIHLILGLLPH